MQCPIKYISHYFNFKGTMGRKRFVGFSLGGYIGLSLLFIMMYIASLTSAEYAALKEYQNTVGNGVLPNGYGFADHARFILSLLLLPAIAQRLHDCGKPLLWLATLAPSIVLSAWALIERPVPVRDDIEAFAHCIFYLLLFLLMIKKTKKDDAK